MQKNNIKAGYLSEFVLLLITVIWGSSFVVSNLALKAGLSSLCILMCRFFLGAVFMGLIYFRRIRAAFRLSHIKYGIILGCIFFFAFYAQMMGLQYSTPSNNAIITSTNVVIVPFICWLITKNKPPRIMFISCAVSLAGISAVSLDFSRGFSFHFGDVFSLLAAVLFAGQIVAVGEMARRIDHCVLVFMELSVSAVLAAIFFFLTGGKFRGFVNLDSALCIFYLGIICTCLCFLLQAWAMRKVNSAKGAVIMSTEALFGSIISIIAGTDILSWRIVLGGILITLSVALPNICSDFSRGKSMRFGKEKGIL